MQLDIRGVSKTYSNGVQALKDVTLTIPPGMYGLLGPNGSGKSTLMRTIATLQDRTAGRFGSVRSMCFGARKRCAGRSATCRSRSVSTQRRRRNACWNTSRHARDAGARGRGFLSESLANNSAMMVTEKTYGPEVGRRLYDFQMERYLNGRASQSREVPLLQVEDQAYIAYRKGAIAMYMLREQIGEERVTAALRRYLEKNRNAAPPYATSLDLYAELRAVTPDSLQSLLVDLFETITLWDVKTERVVVQPTGTGEYRVAIDVVARKMRADGVGKETEVPMDDVVEIGVFAPGPNTGRGEPLYLKPHRIQSGKQTISITVPRAPAYLEGSGAVSPKLRGGGPTRAGVDPSNKLIDRNREDNVVDVKTENGDAS